MTTATEVDQDLDVVVVEDNGNTPQTPEEIAAAEAARTAALRQVAAGIDDPEAGAGKGQFIPKGRFDEVNVRKNALELENAQLLALLAAGGKAPAPTAGAPAAAAEFDARAAMKEKIAALVAGDDDKALELEEKINAHNIKVATAQARAEFEQSNTERTAKQQTEALQTAAAEMKKAYPQLDEKSDKVDPDAIDFVIAKRDALARTGMPPDAALREAVKVVAKRFGFDEPADHGAPSKPNAADDRLVAARARAATAAAQQPPNLGGKGDRATQTARQNVETMTDEEFAALPDAEKRRLRGDM